MFKKKSPEYKKLSKELKPLAPKLADLFGFRDKKGDVDEERVILWFNTSNIAFGGKKPVTMFLRGKGKEVIKYLDRLLVEQHFGDKGV